MQTVHWDEILLVSEETAPAAQAKETTMKHQRQIRRMIDWDDPFAKQQIESALVLHIGYAVATAKYAIKCIFKLQCPMCGRRHVRRIDTYQLWCGYGYFYNFRWLFNGTRCALLHGED